MLLWCICIANIRLHNDIVRIVASCCVSWRIVGGAEPNIFWLSPACATLLVRLLLKPVAVAGNAMRLPFEIRLCRRALRVQKVVKDHAATQL
eukprot:COSAG02_NODE_264_length_26618_cov_244.096459_5_plen_92_part_00